MSLAEQALMPQRRTTRRVRNGKPSNDLVFSAMQGGNDELFPQILSLYVEPGSTIADITYGKGIFWKKVDPKKFTLKKTDLTTGTNCTSLPYRTGSIDCVVFDPPSVTSTTNNTIGTTAPRTLLKNTTRRCSIYIFGQPMKLIASCATVASS